MFKLFKLLYRVHKTRLLSIKTNLLIRRENNMETTRLTQETISEFNERKEIYKRILEKALSDIYTELEEMEFDTGSIDINIRLFNHDFTEVFEVS